MINHWESALYKQKGETLEGNYLRRPARVKRLSRVLSFMEGEIGFDKFNTESKVLEIGCNMALNLRIMNSIYDCRVVGVDINQESIDKCSEWFGCYGQFYLRDLRSKDVLADFKDNEFDLGFSTGVLMHIPVGLEKDRLVGEFLRVCRQVIICEPDRPGHKKQSLCDNEWSVSFEDYTKYSDELERFDKFTAQPEHYIYYKKDLV